ARVRIAAANEQEALRLFHADWDSIAEHGFEQITKGELQDGEVVLDLAAVLRGHAAEVTSEPTSVSTGLSSGHDENVRALAAEIASRRLPAGATFAGSGEVKRALAMNPERVAGRILNAPAGAWQTWEQNPPTAADGEIVARDALGRVSVATHLIHE